MNRHNVFTVIRLMIVIAIIGIIVAIAVGTVPQSKSADIAQEIKQYQCIEGLKFTKERLSGDSPQQIIGPDGGGISCDTISNTENTWQY